MRFENFDFIAKREKIKWQLGSRNFFPEKRKGLVAGEIIK